MFCNAHIRNIIWHDKTEMRQIYQTDGKYLMCHISEEKWILYSLIISPGRLVLEWLEIIDYGAGGCGLGICYFGQLATGNISLSAQQIGVFLSNKEMIRQRKAPLLILSPRCSNGGPLTTPVSAPTATEHPGNPHKACAESLWSPAHML